MANIFSSSSQFSSDSPNSLIRSIEPSAKFYSIFSKKEVLDLIQALEIRKEIPLKYSYKGRGGRIWSNFYQKYLMTRWYRTSNVEIDLLKKNFEYINGNHQNCTKVNIIDVGAGNSYPVKKFIAQLSKLDKINQYIALDISKELLALSKANFTKWFPLIKFNSDTIDIETSTVSAELWQNSTSEATPSIANIFLHLGVTIGNHQDRIRVLQNFRNSMKTNDFLVFTNESGSNSIWDGQARGGCKYHVEEIYAWIKNKVGIIAEDCELVRKYDLKTDSIIANIKFHQNYTVVFNNLGIDKNLEILKDEEITIWRHHKYEMPEILQELEKSGLQLVHYSYNKYFSHIMVICKIAC
ncbi:L-histidine N(alpha)-methyltransferase [Calothrix sp. FACHB-1219]|uniref:L-histidine N(alpha)-methyltransferase n=1 Tax=unclassified Calothrix TaxID=2619626 RepID=UPI0016863CF0|nr:MULTISPECIES: L-histidine N(alpha)-methyltransferase [unclassified Calothrix]MBD2206289.1 L-histidine N(alpha)-methyltransferase [Calothrix sp. FACHB-168]MBD2221071.1 L-histidine N(alpha)-methyltransferase [Calothrix sp. FACHB-1219]